MVYVTGDFHGDYERFNEKNIKKLKKGDYLIILGDFGFVWDGSKKEADLLKKIGKKKFHTLFLDGAYENHLLLSKYEDVEFMGGSAKNICGNLYMLCRGEIYDICNKKFFAIGGTENTDSEADVSNTYDFSRADAEKAMANIINENGVVDYIITHDAPSSVLEFLSLTEASSSLITKLLQKVSETVKYSKWFFGKYHIDKYVSRNMQGAYLGVYALEDTYVPKRKKKEKKKNDVNEERNI